MAQLKDLIVTGATRLIGNAYAGTVQLTTLNAPTAAGGTTYGPGTNGYVLKSNGSSVYWGSDNNSVTGVKGNAESAYRTGQVNLTAANVGAPTTTGSGASGTWSISISGNAATATTAGKFTSAQSITLTGDTTGTASSQAGWSITTTTKKHSQSEISSLSGFTDENALIYAAAGGSNTVTDKPSGVDAFGVFSYKTASGWYGQLLTSSNTGTGLYWRTGTTLSAGWKKVLDNTNYTDYTVTKTGTGASGTWGISITGSSASCTGNAATATKLATARTISLTGSVTGSGSFDGSGNLSITTTTNHNHKTLTVGNKTYNGSSDVTIEIADLGLASTTTFLGLTSTNLSNGSTTNPVTITVGPTTGSVTATNGGVVMEADSGEEYIWSGSKWNLMGLASSWALANHIHGNITNAGTITSDTAKANGQHLVITDSNNKICRSAITLGAATNTYLRNDGSWATLGNAATATKLATARNINGTAFDGSADITTANWGTARTITIGSTGKSVNGSADVSWSKAEILGTSSSAYFYRGDQTWSDTINENTLKITNNSNTLTIGSQNSSYCHIENSANIPFYFNKNICIDGHLYPYGDTNTKNLGYSTSRWAKLYIGTADSYGGTAKPIYWDAGVPTAITETIGDTTTPAYVNAGTLTAGYPYLRYINTNDTTTWTADSLSQTDSIAFTRANITGAYTTGHIVWLNARTIGTPFQLVVHDSSDLYLYKRWYSSDTWSEWTKMNAGYADSAGSATKATQDQNGLNIASGYLKLSGGTMTGAILGSNTNLGSTTAAQHFGQLYLGRQTADSRALDSANPLIEFSNGSRGQYAQIIYTDFNNQGGSDSFTFVSNQSDLRVYAPKVYGAVWNDYAEYRETKEEIEPGRCICEVGDDTLELTTERLQKGCEIVSDTFGFAIGESETAKTPTAASGRVLAYLYEDREIARQHIGDPVCSGPNGTVSIMTEEEEMRYPSRIIGTISAVPDYEIWHAGADGKLEIKVNCRIWIRIR